MARRKKQPSPRRTRILILMVTVPALLLAIGIGAATNSGGWWDRASEWTGMAGGETQAWVNTDVLNLRQGPSTSSEVIRAATFGDEVTITGSAREGFVPVTVDGQPGWMSEQFLARDRQPNTLAASTGVLPQDAVAAEPPAGSASAPSAPVEDVAAENEPAPQEVVAAPEEDVEQEAAPQPGERWIEIDRSSATVTLHNGEIVVAQYSGRIGRDPSADGFYSTAVGTYAVYSMNKGLSPTPFAEDTYLTDWVGFDPERKNGIHSPVRDANGVEKEWQNQTTLGCVRLSAADAVSVFEFAEIGMRVEVHD